MDCVLVTLLYIHTYIYLISRFVISNCTADVDLLLLSLDKRTKIYNTVIKDKKTNQIILKYLNSGFLL